jgi:hypothetical protein
MGLRLRRMLTAMIVMGALGATTSASASAASWYVGGTELTGSALLASSTVKSAAIRVVTFGAEIECSGIELKNADIAATHGGQAEHLLFTGCKVVSANCHLQSSTIETKALTMEAALGSKSPEDKVVFKPTAGAGKPFAAYVLEGSQCASSGEVIWTGRATLALPKGQEEAAEQELNIHVSEASGELKYGASAVALEGKVKLKLASGKAWSFH